MTAVAPLPALLQRHLHRCLGDVEPIEATGSVIEQSGEMRLAQDGRWVPFTAEQWFQADDVAFRWHARVKMAPLVTAVVEDAYQGEHGTLDAKIWGVLPVAHAEGLEIDRGEIQRYLAELPWNPLALVRNPRLRFGEGSDGPVRVWCNDPATHVDLRFDDAGDVVGTFTRTRSKDGGECHPWEGVFSDYRSLGGVRLPTRAEVSWHLPTGRFVYFRGRVDAFSWRD